MWHYAILVWWHMPACSLVNDTLRIFEGIYLSIPFFRLSSVLGRQGSGNVLVVRLGMGEGCGTVGNVSSILLS